MAEEEGGWEIVPSKGGGGGGQHANLTENEVSVVTSKVKNNHIWRINMLRCMFPKEVRSVIMKKDVAKKRIGFFEVDTTNEEQLFLAKKFGSYGKNSKGIYISGPKAMAAMGFKDKGTRYKVIKPKVPVKGLYFYIDAERLMQDEEVTPKKTT